MLSFGEIIVQQRKQKGWTQKQLADQLLVSDKAISKWERNQGMPDIGLLEPLARTLGLSLEELFAGEIPESEKTMKHTCFYYCPHCGNLITGSKPALLSCCGQPMKPMIPQEVQPEHTLNREVIEGEWYFTSDHPMTKDHYITFVALVTDWKTHISRQYPEQMLSLRLPHEGHGKLYYYCSQHGFFMEKI